MKLIYNTKSIKLVSEDDLSFEQIETHPPERSNLKVWEGAIKRFPLKVVIRNPNLQGCLHCFYQVSGRFMRRHVGIEMLCDNVLDCSLLGVTERHSMSKAR